MKKPRLDGEEARWEPLFESADDQLLDCRWTCLRCGCEWRWTADGLPMDCRWTADGLPMDLPTMWILVHFWSPILVLFLVLFGSRISQFYWVFCVPRVVFGPFLDVFWTVLFGTLLPSVRRPHDLHPLRHFGSRVRRTWDRRLFVGFGRDFHSP
jgi:hypothetical protein